MNWELDTLSMYVHKIAVEMICQKLSTGIWGLATRNWALLIKSTLEQYEFYTIWTYYLKWEPNKWTHLSSLVFSCPMAPLVLTPPSLPSFLFYPFSIHTPHISNVLLLPWHSDFIQSPAPQLFSLWNFPISLSISTKHLLSKIYSIWFTL